MQDLKPQLSAVVAEAEAGQTVVITRHGKAVAQLGPADSPAVDPPYVHRGKLVGQPWPPAIPTVRQPASFASWPRKSPPAKS